MRGIKEKMKAHEQNPRVAVRMIFDSGIKAADPYECVKRHLDDVRDTYDRMEFERFFVVAFGKAAYSMCKAVEELFGELINEGVAITKYDHGGELERIKLYEASHPVPDMNGIEATEEVIDLLENADEKSLVLFLISGGGSALLVSPWEGITLEDKRNVTERLMKAGANIRELNCVRKHLSRVKGGRLAKIASPASMMSFIISDVVGDYLDVVASGPTAPDTSTFGEAMEIMEKYGLKDCSPPSVLNLLAEGNLGMIGETPKLDDDVFTRVKNTVIGNNGIALESARLKAAELGFRTEIISAEVTGEARYAARKLADFVLEKKKDMEAGKKLCFIWGGETTVTVKGQGKGGRNTELALAFAKRINGVSGITLLSAGTDGTDGPTDAAGAIVDGKSVFKGAEKGLDPGYFLDNNDSYNYFRQTGELLITGPTGTNVMDIQILIVQ